MFGNKKLAAEAASAEYGYSQPTAERLVTATETYQQGDVEAARDQLADAYTEGTDADRSIITGRMTSSWRSR